MPILTPALIASIRAKLDAEYGPINPALKPAEIALLNASRDKMARTIAESGTYVRDNATVPFPIAVQVVPATGTGGTTATGSLT